MRILLLSLLLVMVAACTTTTEENIKLARDVNEVLSALGVTSIELDCSMLGDGISAAYNGICLLKLPEPETTQIVSGLNLSKVTDLTVNWGLSGPDCWTRLEFVNRENADWYESTIGDSRLHLSDNRQFEYLRLFVHPMHENGCISVAYSFE